MNTLRVRKRSFPLNESLLHPFIHLSAFTIPRADAAQAAITSYEPDASWAPTGD